MGWSKIFYGGGEGKGRASHNINSSGSSPHPGFLVKRNDYHNPM